MKKVLGFDLIDGTMSVTGMADQVRTWTLTGPRSRDEDILMGPHAAVLHYGRSIFEGLKAFRMTDGQVYLFRASQNARRMREGAEAFGLIPLPEELFLQIVHETVRENIDLIPACGEGALYIRPLLMDAGQVMGLSSSGTCTIQVTVNPVGDYFAGGTGVYLYYNPAWVRTAPGMGGTIKAGGNYGLGIPRKKIAKENECAEVIYTRAGSDHIDECGAANVFLVKDKLIFTPSLRHGTILPGITRDSVIHLARHLGYTVFDSLDIPIDFQADECFLTGTAAGITPVLGWRGSDGRGHTYSSKVGPITEYLSEELSGIRDGRSPDQFGWLEEVEL